MEKRSNEGTASDDVAPKKAKLATDDCYEVVLNQYCDCEYGDVNMLPIRDDRAALRKLRQELDLKEIKGFLISKGLSDIASSIKTHSDVVNMRGQWLDDFEMKGWHYDSSVLDYNDYQRLIVHDQPDSRSTYYMTGATLECELAYPEFYRQVLEELKWDDNWSEAWKKVEDKILPSFPTFEGRGTVIRLAIQECLFRLTHKKRLEELIPFYTELWMEVCKKKRDYAAVLLEFNEKSSYPSLISWINLDIKEMKCYGLPSKFIPTIDDIEVYFNTHWNDMVPHCKNSVEEYIKRSVCRDLGYSRFDYIDFILKKLEVAEKIGIIPGGTQASFRASRRS